MIRIDEFAVRDHRRRVIDVRAIRIDVAHDDHQFIGGGDDSFERLAILAHEMRLEQQVFGWVAGEREFGKRDQVSSGRSRSSDVVEHQSGVGCEVADRRIDLGKCDSDGVHERVRGP